MKELAAILAFVLMTVFGTIAAAFVLYLLRISPGFGITPLSIIIGFLVGLYSAFSSYKAQEKRQKKHQLNTWNTRETRNAVPCSMPQDTTPSEDESDHDVPNTPVFEKDDSSQQKKSQETPDDNLPLLHVKDCPHCNTKEVLPMTGNICPNCKKQLDVE